MARNKTTSRKKAKKPPPPPKESDTSESEEDVEEAVAVEAEQVEEVTVEENDNASKKRRATTDSSPQKLKRPVKRGPGYTTEEVLHFLDVLEKHLPIGPAQWEAVIQEHIDAGYPEERYVVGLRRKFNGLVQRKEPTGDPNCPVEVRRAKQISRMIEEKMDAATEMEDEDFGFSTPFDDNNDDNNNIATGTAATAAASSPVVPASAPSPVPAFRQRRAVSSVQTPADTMMNQYMQLMMTKMMADMTKSEEIREERARQRKRDDQRQDMMTMMMMGMASLIIIISESK